jgi:hypothetical protein
MTKLWPALVLGTCHAASGEWWSGMRSNVGSYLPAAIQAPASGLQVGEGATCPEVPGPIASWQLAADGECHAVTEHTFGSTILLKVKCNSDGSTLVTYADLTNTSTTMQCDNEAYDANYSIPEAYCFTSEVAGISGSRLLCMDNNTRVDYKGWAAKLAPPANQTTVSILMRDGAELETTALFSPAAAFPPTGKSSDTVATMMITTPYDLHSDFTKLALSLGTIFNSVTEPNLHIPFTATTLVQQSRGLYRSGIPTQPTEVDNFQHSKNDSSDTAAWITGQNWSNGVILAQGISAMGMFSLLGNDASPGFTTRAAWLQITTNDLREALYRQGAIVSGIMNSIMLPGFIPHEQFPREQWARHEGDGPDPFWDALRFDDWSSKVTYPSIVVTGW